MRKPKPMIDRDLGTKRECITDLRGLIILATRALDNRNLHTAIHIMEVGIAAVKKKLPREKIVKPFKK